jgi:hypothetical protein
VLATEEELLDATTLLEDDLLEEEEVVATELLEEDLLEELEDGAALLELEVVVVVPAYEHHAVEPKLFDGKLLDAQATPLVKVP